MDEGDTATVQGIETTKDSVEDVHHLYTRTPSSESCSEQEDEDSGGSCDDDNTNIGNFDMEEEGKTDTTPTLEVKEEMLESAGMDSTEVVGGSVGKVEDTMTATYFQSFDDSTTIKDEVHGVQNACDDENINGNPVDTWQECPSKKENTEGSEDKNEYGTDRQSKFKIFVSNLPPGLLSSELQELFEKFGEVVQCELFSQHYAFVHMTSEDNGFQAMDELNGLEIRGCKINVKRSVQTDNLSSFQPQSKKQETNKLEVGTFKIYIGNLTANAEKEYVTKLLEEFGRVVEVEMFRNTAAFVHMETEDGGNMAIEKLNGKILTDNPDKALRVTASTNPRGPSLTSIRLKIANIPKNTTASELRSWFTPYALVLETKIFPKVHPVFGGTRQGTVLLEQYGNIRSAIKELSGKEICGSKLSVEATFDTATSSQQGQIRTIRATHPQENLGWQGSNFPSFHPTSSYGCGPPPVQRMRLIPMPSQAELSRGRMGQRGRFPLRGRGRPHLMHQQTILTNSFQQGPDCNSHTNYREEFDTSSGYQYEDCNNFNNYTGNSDYTNYESSSRKRPYGKTWNNDPGRNYSFNPWENNECEQERGSNGENPFPDFPNSEDFPAGPPELMSLQIQNLISEGNDNDWSADLPLSSFSSDFSTGNQTFSGGGPSTSSMSSTHAIPFDYSQINKKWPNKQAFPQGNNHSQRNIPFMKRKQQNRGGNNNRQGKFKKGKARHPGLGTVLQQKKFAEQSVDTDIFHPSTNNVEHSSNTMANEVPASSSSNTPAYFQQNWSFKTKSKNSRPSTRQIKDAEEEQKRQYADFLKQKPWLYQAIPGTVKRVEK